MVLMADDGNRPIARLTNAHLHSAYGSIEFLDRAGKKPDMGAHEAGTPLMTFGVRRETDGDRLITTRHQKNAFPLFLDENWMKPDLPAVILESEND